MLLASRIPLTLGDAFVVAVTWVRSFRHLRMQRNLRLGMHLLFYGGAQIKFLHNKTVEGYLKELSERVSNADIVTPRARIVTDVAARQNLRHAGIHQVYPVVHRDLLHPPQRVGATRYLQIQVVQ